MMKRTNAAVLGALAAAGLLAAGPAMSAGDHMAMSMLPPQHRQGNVTYVSGGIGQAEAAAMRREQSTFPLSLEFLKRASSGDQYLADVAVTIKDPHGNTVLDTVTNGPFLLARLPDGKYTVTADSEGQARTRNIVITGQKPEHVVVAW